MRWNRSIAALILIVGILVSDRLEAQITECSAPDADILTGSTTTDEISIADDLNLTDVKVQVEITHAFIGELLVTAASPNATRLVLMNKIGGTDDNVSVTFSDAGVEHGSETFVCECEMQPYGPGSFADMDSESSSGTWTLEVEDHFGTATGVLNGWCVIAEGCELPAPEFWTIVDEDGGEVTFSWENAGSYESIAVIIDGTQAATPSRDATGATVSGLRCGRHSAYLEVTSSGVACSSTTKPLKFTACLEEFCVTGVAIPSSPVPRVVTLEVPDDITMASVDVPFRMPEEASILFTIELTSPAGTSVGLHESGGSDSDAFDLVWDDAGIDNGNPYDCECAMKPSGPGSLSDFTDESSSGVWSLELSGFGSGTIDDWCLGIQPQGEDCLLDAPTSVTCSASGCDVAISWDIADDYEFIEIFRDDVRIKTVGGSTTQCLDKPGCSGTFAYTVEVHGAARDCTATSPTCESTVDFQIPVAVDLFEVEGGTAVLDLPGDALQAGSEPIITTIDLSGVRLGIGGPFELGTTDFVMIRNENAVLPDVPSEDVVPFSLMELSLGGVEPLSVLVAGKPSSWRVNVFIATEDDPAVGDVTFLRDADGSGTYDLEAAIAPLFFFQREELFLRGDSNFDFDIDISDPIFSLQGLFLGRPSICLDAQDVNDDGVVGFADVVLLLDFMFDDGREPAAPFQLAGADQTDDGLGCEASTGEAVWDFDEFVISGTGGNWSALEDCSTSELAVPRLGLGPCMQEITLTSEILELTLVPPQSDPDRPPADVDAGAIIDPEVASLGRGAIISGGVVVGPRVVVGPGAFVGENAGLQESCLIGAQVFLGAEVHIGANTIIDAGTVAYDDVIIGGDTRIGHGCLIAGGVTIGGGCQIGDGTEIGAGTIIGDGVTLKGGVIVGSGVSVLDGISLEAGYVVEDDTEVSESVFTCTEELDRGEFIGTIEECEAAGGAVLGHLPDLRGEGLQEPVAPAESYTIHDISRYVDPLKSVVLSAGADDPRGPIHLRTYVPKTYDCDDFASDLEIALEQLGYHATITSYFTWEDNPEWRWYNFIWTSSTVNTEAHAITDVHVDGELIWIEPQTGEIGINLDFDGDGEVKYDTELGRPGSYTDGQTRIEVWQSRAEAEAAGEQYDE